MKFCGEITLRAGLMAVLLSSASLAAAAGDPDAGRDKSDSCAACHGEDGNSTNPEWPKLAAQHSSYLRKQLDDFKTGRRQSAIMEPIAAGLTEQDVKDIAAYYESRPRAGGSAQAELVRLGEKIYRSGSSEIPGLAACMSCHGPAGGGNPMAAFPRVAGQHAAYTAKQLKAFRDKARTNDPYEIMRTVARRMSDEEINAVANYMAGLHRSSALP